MYFKNVKVLAAYKFILKLAGKIKKRTTLTIYDKNQLEYGKDLDYITFLYQALCLTQIIEVLWNVTHMLIKWS